MNFAQHISEEMKTLDLIKPNKMNVDYLNSIILIMVEHKNKESNHIENLRKLK